MMGILSLPKSTIILEFNVHLLFFFLFPSFKSHIGFGDVVWTHLHLCFQLIDIFNRS